MNANIKEYLPPANARPAAPPSPGNITVSEFSEDTGEFLFACAFWAVAGDEQLRPGEQVWLNRQFGEERSRALLAQISALKGDAFFEVFDALTRALSERDKRRIYPGLEDWLTSCICSDGIRSEGELEVIAIIRERLSLDAEIRRFRSESAKTPSFHGHAGEVTSVAFGRDGRTAFSGSEDTTIRMWDCEAGSEIRVLEPQAAGVLAIALCPAGGPLLSGNRAGVLSAWNPDTGAALWQVAMKRQGGVADIGVAPDGASFVAASEVGLLDIFKVSDGTLVQTIGRRGRPVSCARFSNDGRRILSGGDDRTLRMWDAASGKAVAELAGHRDGILALAMAPDGETALSASRDNDLILWNLRTGKQLSVFAGHTFSVRDVIFNRDGRFAVSASTDHTIRLWETASAASPRKHEEYRGGFSSIALHPNGADILAGCSDSLVYLIRDFAPA